MPRAYLKIRLDRDCQAGEFEIKIAKDSTRIDEKGNLHLTYVIAKPPPPAVPVNLATTPAKTIKVKAKGFRKRGY